MRVARQHLDVPIPNWTDAKGQLLVSKSA